jgi:hypothetical protein
MTKCVQDAGMVAVLACLLLSAVTMDMVTVSARQSMVH